MHRTTLTAVLLIAQLSLGCATESSGPDEDGNTDELPFGDLLGKRSDYAFPEACQGTADSDTCFECCEMEGFDQAYHYENECGCQSTESNDVVCNPSVDADACDSCCTDNQYTGYFTVGDECTCLRSSTEPMPTP